MRQVERDTNSVRANSARGIKVELRAIFTEGMLRLRPTIFTRELCENAKLLWGDPAEIPLPPVPSSGEAISKYDAFRLLNNRIIEQIAVRSEYADRNSDSTADRLFAGQILDRPGNVAVGFPGVLSIRISEQAEAGRGRACSQTRKSWEARCAAGLISRFRNAMAQKLGQTGFPSGRSSRSEFSEAVEIARATWNWESGQLLGTTAAAGDWRGIFARLSRLENRAATASRLGAR